MFPHGMLLYLDNLPFRHGTILTRAGWKILSKPIGLDLSYYTVIKEMYADMPRRRVCHQRIYVDTLPFRHGAIMTRGDWKPLGHGLCYHTVFKEIYAHILTLCHSYMAQYRHELIRNTLNKPSKFLQMIDGTHGDPVNP